MALKATVFKCELQVSDLDRHHYHTYSLTLAQHPSETDERLMLRLLAFALFADERLEFTRGLSADDEPDLWLRHLHGDVDLWIDLGLPEERRIRRAASRADRAVIIAYGGNAAPMWWKKHAEVCARHANLAVLHVDRETSEALGKLASRNLQLSCTIQDGQAWLSDGTTTVTCTPETWQAASR